MKGGIMDKESIINQVVEKAYMDLKDIVNLNCYVLGGYFEMIIPESKVKELSFYTDEIVNQLFEKFCLQISKKITKADIQSISYYSYCFAIPNQQILAECFEFVNNAIFNNNGDKEKKLYPFLKKLETKYNKDAEEYLNIVFDILLDYYSIIK